MTRLNKLNNDSVSSPEDDTQTPTKTGEKESRRRFLKSSVGAGAAIATGAGLSLSTNTVLADNFSARRPDRSLNGEFRAIAAANLKVEMAEQHFNETIVLPGQKDNRDERRYKDERYLASYSKALPCNYFGEVEVNAFQKLRRAMRRGRESDFRNIELDEDADRRLVSPQAAFKFEPSALDSHATRINPSYQFRSAELAAQAGEVYWQAITRDVPFIDYTTNNLVNAAVDDLNNFSITPGATNNGELTAQRLFRGETPGDLTGPYISQFLLQDVTFGPSEMVQRYQEPLQGRNFMTDHDSWLAVQRGINPRESMHFDSTRRYVYNSRTLGEYVHRDVSFQAYLNACAILLNLGPDAVDPSNPYADTSRAEEGFVTFGAPFATDLVTRVASIAFSGAWFQKWRVHRFLRPEAYGGRVHMMLTRQRRYELHSDILNCDAVARVFSDNGSYFLPQAFAEGSPTHPSFPAGHACVAGACVTALKAVFNENYVLDNPVEADATGTLLLPYSGSDITVGGELNKLANNIALGRDAAGVHYRQDGIEGLKAGEQQAIAYLQDQTRTLKEANFSGFNLTKFDGTRIVVKNGQVILV